MYEKAIKKAKFLISGIPFPGAGGIILIIAGILSGGAEVLRMISPFGAACAGAYAASGKNRLYILLPVAGCVLFNYNAEAICCVAECLIIFGLSFKSGFIDKHNLWNVVSACLAVLCPLAFFLPYGLSIYNVAVALLEGISAYFLVGFYTTFSMYFSGKKLRKTVSKRELTAVFVVAFSTLSAFSGIELAFDITLCGVLSVFIILCCAIYTGPGMCTAIGTALGIFAGLSNPLLIYTVGSYSVSAFFSSIAGKYGKVCTVLTFIICNAVMTFYINGSEGVLINLYEILIAGGLFFAVPCSKLKLVRDSLMLLLTTSEGEEKKRMEILKGITCERLKNMSGAFSSLASVLAGDERKKARLGERELNDIVEGIAERSCRGCRGCRYCWKDNFADTYSVFSALVRTIEKRGWAEGYDLSPAFKNVCYNTPAVVLEANKIYEIYRVNTVWESRISENKQVISGQLKGVSRAVDELAAELEDGCCFLSEAEKNMIELLDSVGVYVLGVSAFTGTDKRLQMRVSVRKGSKRQNTDNILIAAAGRVVGKNMCITNKYDGGEGIIAELCEDENFVAETAVSRVRPKGESECGDSYAIIRPGAGKLIVALSDGMGTGSGAARESEDTVRLLERLLVAGIDKSTAIKLINSVLILKSFDESFATLDMLVLDLYTGEGEFIKTGGVSSYIKRGSNIIEVQSGSLPSGIIETAEASDHKVMLKGGDTIVIVSDGVTDVRRDSGWLAECIRKNEITDCKAFADSVMAAACSGLSSCRDDMTVIAVKLYQK